MPMGGPAQPQCASDRQGRWRPPSRQAHGAHPRPPPPVQVRVAFGWQSLEVWAVGQGHALHLHVPKLWGRILPGKCGVKVNTRTRKLSVCLYKETDAEWRYLKGF